MVIADTEISEDKREIDAPKSILKRHRAPSIGKMKKRVHWADQKSVDVPVLVVGTKSWPALSDAQTPKPNNHVQNVAVPAYAFPPGSGPYPNGLNPKPVSLVAAAQESTERRKKIIRITRKINLNERVSVQDPSEHSMEQHQQEKSNTDITELDRAFMKLFLNTDENNLIQAESVPGESHAPKRINRKRVHWAEDGKSVDVPVLVVGTKSWPALSDVQTPKAKNLVDNVSAKGENVAVSVPSVGHIAPRAPSVQKANSSGNFSPMNKMPSPSYQKPGPKRNVRPVAPPPHIAVPAYAFPPGSGPYPNGENPKPVSPVAAGQGFTPPARAIDAKHFPSFPENMERRKRKSLARHNDLNEQASVQDPSERDQKKRNSNDSLFTLPANQQTRNLQQITQTYHLVLLYPIGTTPPVMKKLEKMCNWLAKEL